MRYTGAADSPNQRYFRVPTAATAVQPKPDFASLMRQAQAHGMPAPLLPAPRGVIDPDDVLMPPRPPRRPREDLSEVLWKLVVCGLISLAGLLVWGSDTVQAEYQGTPTPTATPTAPSGSQAAIATAPAVPSATNAYRARRLDIQSTATPGRVAIPTQSADAPTQSASATTPQSTTPPVAEPTSAPAAPDPTTNPPDPGTEETPTPVRTTTPGSASPPPTSPANP